MTGRLQKKGSEPPAIAAAIFLPIARKEWPLLLAYRPPRMTVLLPLPSWSPASTALALQSVSDRDITVALIDRGRRREADVHREISTLLPRAELLAVDPKAVLRFLWFYRDGYDPLALGHACSRMLLDETYAHRPVPDIRRARRKKERRNAEKDLRLLVREIGAGLGVAPPLPPVAPAENGWSPARLAGLYDACAGLFAALLHRWGSPLALVEEDEGGVNSLGLADQWILTTQRPPGLGTRPT